jgi:small subunit ribosomal protein S16
MAVKIRLARIRKKNVPFARIVAIDSRKKRDGAYLEDLGTYDMLKSKLVVFHADRINDWIAKGAVVTDSVKKLQRLHSKEAQQEKPVAKAARPKKTQAVEKAE